MSINYHIKQFLDEDSETFSYVVFDKQTKKAMVIDPVLDFDYKSGRTYQDGVEKIASYINEHNLTLEWVLETHAHADHISGAPFFKKQFGAKIGIGEHIKHVQKTFKTLFNLEKEFLPDGAQFDRLFKDGEIFHVGELTIRVMHTPGHTPADLAYLIDESVIFVGDTIFMPDVGTARCDFPGGSSSQLFDSIKKVLALPDETTIQVCHDYPNESRDYRHSVTVKEQKESNIHVNNSVIKEQFIEMRETRDKTLSMPRLILPAIQLNVRAGNFPPADNNGVSYLKVPLNQL
ncbi:MBL fold metallo-hydrolase [Pseudoalteromonas sp.]|uniref:MBL fold metallo-hydrolase n=1 Tax=Pseudoalteromonas sp. TaxID=53249 RepID=UPI001BCAAAE1|nr:MBL fold metallo-hydrolase [Pseudoalteromonas sp.]